MTICSCQVSHFKVRKNHRTKQVISELVVKHVPPAMFLSNPDLILMCQKQSQNQTTFSSPKKSTKKNNKTKTKNSQSCGISKSRVFAKQKISLLKEQDKQPDTMLTAILTEITTTFSKRNSTPKNAVFFFLFCCD